MTAPDFPEPVYRAQVRRIIDADTIEVAADLGFFVTRVLRVRLVGVDAPELRSTDPDERERARAAKALTASLVPVGQWVLLRTHKGRSFDRWLAEVKYWNAEEWADLAATLVAAGYDVA